jgi:hypothetical protein
MLVMARQRWTNVGKERIAMRSSINVVSWRVSRLWGDENVDGKKKVMKKQRRSTEMH